MLHGVLHHLMVLVLVMLMVLMMMNLRRLRSSLEFNTALLVVASSSVHPTIPPVLHGVVAAAAKSPCDLCPSLAHLSDHLFDQNPLFGGDGVMIEIGLQVLVIPLSALLWRASLNGRRYPHPVVSSVDGDQMQEELVFLL